MKILVAEDEPEILQIYKIVLESEGHEVHTAKDGQQCMETYNNMLNKATDIGNPAFDLLILDHRMPKKTGLEVANEVLGICPAQEILMVTAYGGELDLTDNLQKMKIMRKPFEVDELISWVRNMSAKAVVSD
ncbi:MAG: two-component system cell cycle response regulator CpdR [Candidatus Nitrosomirales archaeon]